MSHSPAYSKASHSAAFCYVRSAHKQGGEHKFQSAKTVATALPVPSRQQLRGKAFFAKWSSVDWSKQDAELAAETGLSRERIRQIRQLVGAPKSPHHGRVRKSAGALRWAKDNLDNLKGLSAAELGRKYGLSPHWRVGPLYQFLKPVLRDGRFIRKHRWDLMNFRLPNRDLERIWRLPFNAAGSYRRRNQRPTPTWAFKRGHPQFSGRGQLQAYHRAVKTEGRIAARYFAHA
jgi:hypothetical protein